MSMVRGWWERKSPRTRARLRYWLPLLGLAVVVAIDWWRLHQGGITTRTEARHLFLLIGVAIVFSLLIKLAFSRSWPLQELGHLGVLLGLAGLALRILGRYGPQPVPEWERDLTQALLDIGAAALLVGMVLWLIGQRRGADQPSDPPEDSSGAVYDRRSGRDRRKGWGRLR